MWWGRDFARPQPCSLKRARRRWCRVACCAGASERQRDGVPYCAHAGGGEVDGVVVADEGVDADGGDEADGAGDGKGLPEVAGGGSAPGAGGDEEADVEHAATEAGAVVGDERNEAGVEGVELG